MEIATVYPSTSTVSDFGPIPVSRIKDESSRIFEALGAGRRVLISRRGTVVAAIDPPAARDVESLVSFALPGSSVLDELTATDINRGSPSRAVDAAAGGQTLYLTRNDKVYGMMRPLTTEDLARTQLSTPQIIEREALLADFLADHPDASAGDIVAFSDATTRSLLDERNDGGTPLQIPDPVDESTAELIGDLHVALRRQFDSAVSDVNRLAAELKVVVEDLRSTDESSVPDSVTLPVAHSFAVRAEAVSALLEGLTSDLDELRVEERRTAAGAGA